MMFQCKACCDTDVNGQQDKLTDLTSGVLVCKQDRHLVGETKDRGEAAVMVEHCVVVAQHSSGWMLLFVAVKDCR